MKQLTKVAVVFLLVSSLVIGQNEMLLAQSNSPATGTVVTNTLATDAGLKNLLASTMARPASSPLFASNVALLPAASSSLFPPPAPRTPQASSKNWGLIAGLAMSGTGAILVARKEPVHQTTCIPYDACPVPGIVRMSGGLLLGIGVPLTILKLKR